MLYAVCTNCTFLRAYGERATDAAPLENCPACGSELVIQGHAERFEPAYVGRVTLNLHAAPALGRE